MGIVNVIRLTFTHKSVNSLACVKLEILLKRNLEQTPYCVRSITDGLTGTSMRREKETEERKVKPGRAIEEINEQHPHRGDWLREIVFGLNDGLVTTLVFIMAVSGVAPNYLVAVVLGEVLAGGVSMALGGYLSARTEQEILEQRIATE